MAAEAKHFIFNTQIYPANGDDMGFIMNFNDDREGVTQNELSVKTVILTTEAKKIVINEIKSGKGIFQGIPYRVEIEDVIIEYYIDLTDLPKISGEGDADVEVQIKKRKSFAYFKKNANNLSFEALNKTHPISTVDTKYLIVRDDQGILIITSLMAAYSLAIVIAQQVKSLVEAIGDLISAIIPNIGVGVGVVVVTKPAEIIWAILKAIVQIIFLLLVILAFINMMKQLVEIIYPRVREFKSATMHELISKGCSKLGFSFQSSIITPSSAFTIMPVPVVDTSTSNAFLDTINPPIQSGQTKGYPTARDTVPTLGKLIDAALDMFNGKLIVDNGVVKLERRDFLKKTSSKTVKNTLNIQSKRENQWTYNTGDSWKRYFVHYQVDYSDSFTTSDSKGTKAEYSTEPINVIDADLVNIDGLMDVNIPFAFGIRKDSLNDAENFWKNICVKIDQVAGIFGAKSNIASKVKARIGVVQISKPQYSITKLLYQIGSKQPANYRDFLNANSLYVNFHKINEVDVNLKRIYAAEMPFSSKEYKALQNNNYIYDEEGDQLEILDLEWLNKTKTAEIEYAVPATESTNTKTIRIDV